MRKAPPVRRGAVVDSGLGLGIAGNPGSAERVEWRTGRRETYGGEWKLRPKWATHRAGEDVGGRLRADAAGIENGLEAVEAAVVVVGQGRSCWC